MKKVLFLGFVVVAFSTSMNAQFEQVKNKNGVAVLPEAKSYGLGFDALPVFQFIGNMFNGSANNNISANWANNASGSVYGKYFLTETKAIRARLSILQSTLQDVNTVTQDGQGQANITVDDEKVTSNFTASLGGGLEFRRGKGRLFGVYGGEAWISLNTQNQKITYGNEFSTANQNPTSTTDFNSSSGNPQNTASRVVSVTNPNSFGLGARAFAGVEYFFAPQMSVGAEFFLGISYVGANKSELVSESWDAVGNQVIQTNSVGGARLTNFGIATGNWGGSINLMFHF